MKFQNRQVMNFKNAFRGLRNPLNSWQKSDSYANLTTYEDDIYLEQIATKWTDRENELRKKEGKEPYSFFSVNYIEVLEKYMDWLSEQGTINNDPCYNCAEVFYIGPKDLDLAQRMVRAGSSDRKFLRQIMVSIDITAPLYWWKEFDTYKVGTVANSTSTMHKLSSTPITIDCFERDDFNSDLTVYNGQPYQEDYTINDIWTDIIIHCETLRQRYNETKDKKYWKELIRLLPESWLQTRTVTMNYEILRNIYSQRKNHRLTEWHQFCDWIKTLPYAGELILHNLD